MEEMQRVVAVDWSGRVDAAGQRRHNLGGGVDGKTLWAAKPGSRWREDGLGMS